ncbi:MAG: ABC transporter ATP-binding protein [Planctomycetes bacterium]|nr:ABC transporter ATP-binding protein [Planctomycetota bacterium]
MVNAAVLLEARDVEFAYGTGAPVLRGLSLELRGGRLVALLGPNAAGKSTLLRVLAGSLRPQRGAVHSAGGALLALPVRERARRIALVPQALSSLPLQTLEDFVLGGRYAHQAGALAATRADREVVARALIDCDLAGCEHNLLDELSGGQRQRALLARALAQQAGVLLVDEPTNALDPEHQLAVFDLLARLARDGRAVAVVTHDMNLAGQYADEVLLLARGELCARGAPERILQPAQLVPVYGSRLWFGSFHGRPCVLPARDAGQAEPGLPRSDQGPR